MPQPSANVRHINYRDPLLSASSLRCSVLFAALSLIGCTSKPETDPAAREIAESHTVASRDKLLAKIKAQDAPAGSEIVVSLDDFFTGNEDRGSIGVNLAEKQPPIAEFHRVLSAIRGRPNVQDVLVRIFDYNDPTSWPYTDTVYILTSADENDVREWVAPLLPDEVYRGWMYGTPPAAPDLRPGVVAYSIWWD